MNPLSFPLLADENIHPGVVDFLKEAGINVVTVREEGLGGKSDLAILRFAARQGRVILTHDNDFGRLMHLAPQELRGIIYLHPGHIRPEFTIDTLQFLASRTWDISPPFIIVAERTDEQIRVRARQL